MTVGKTDPTFFTNMLGDKLLKVTKFTFGRDDINTQNQINHYMTKFNLKQRYHSHNHENIHFLHMDTSGSTSDWDTTSDQYNFIVNDLRRTNANPAISWIIVLLHRAMYGSTTSSDTTKILSASLRDIYHPIFQQYNVHIVIQGYFKNYQRMHCLQYNEGSPNQPTSVHSSDAPNYIIPIGQKGFGDGCIFLNVGTGGAGHESIDNPASYSITNNSIDFGVLVPFFDNTSLDAIGHKVAVRFYDTSHKIKDEFTISHLIP